MQTCWWMSLFGHCTSFAFCKLFSWWKYCHDGSNDFSLVFPVCITHTEHRGSLLCHCSRFAFSEVVGGCIIQPLRVHYSQVSEKWWISGHSDSNCFVQLKNIVKINQEQNKRTKLNPKIQKPTTKPQPINEPKPKKTCFYCFWNISEIFTSTNLTGVSTVGRVLSMCWSLIIIPSLKISWCNRLSFC